jgi:hypothetical protein
MVGFEVVGFQIYGFFLIKKRVVGRPEPNSILPFGASFIFYSSSVL